MGADAAGASRAPSLCWATMTALPRSLADSLRRFDDKRLRDLLAARPDLRTPVPRGIGPLAARAAAAGSVRRALHSLTRPELMVAEALAVLPEAVTSATLAPALGADEQDLAPLVARLETLGLLWRGGAAGETAAETLNAVRALREVLPTPAGLAPAAEDDPSPAEASARVAAAPTELREVLERLTWAPALLEAAEDSALAHSLDAAGLVQRRGGRWLIPRPVHLALRGSRLREQLPLIAPALATSGVRERIPGARDAQALETALDAVRILATLAAWEQDPPGVLRRGGLPQRELRRLAREADAPEPVFTLVVHTAWSAGWITSDGESWELSPDGAAVLAEGPDQQWGHLVTAWWNSASLASTPGSPPGGTGAPGHAEPAALSAGSSRTGLRARRRALWEALGHPGSEPGATVAVTEDSLAEALAWRFPLIPRQQIAQETAAVLAEATALGLLLDAAPTMLGRALLAHLGADPAGLATELGAALAAHIPPPVDEVFLDADLTALIPGRPSPRLETLLAWTRTVSRGGALTLRFTPASVRAALMDGGDVDDLRELLAQTSRAPLPDTLEHLLRDESRRHGQVRVGRAASYLTAAEPVLTLLATSPHAQALALERLAPTVAVTQADRATVMQCVRRAGMSGIAIGPDGDPVPERPSRRRSAPPSGEDAEGPDLRLSPEQAVARLREADANAGGDLAVTDRLLEAIAQGTALRLGIVDGRGGILVREAVPQSLEGGRLRARDSRGDDEFTVLVHRVTLG